MEKCRNINDEQVLDAYMMAEFNRREQAFSQANDTAKSAQIAAMKQAYAGKNHADKKLAYRALLQSQAVHEPKKGCCVIL